MAKYIAAAWKRPPQAIVKSPGESATEQSSIPKMRGRNALGKEVVLVSLDRWLQIHTATLAVLGALFLGLGQNHTVLPLVLAFAAVISVTGLPLLNWLRMNRILANVVALGAVLWSLRDFFSTESDRQLIAIADMLVYLQIVLLFQGKTQRIYWQLLVLSLLQVVVAAALNLGPQFGLLLAVYISIAISALVLLCLHRECVPPDSVPATPIAPAQPKSAGQRLLGSPIASEYRYSLTSRSLRHWPSMVFRQVGLLACATMVFAVIFFYATPRLGEGAWQGPRGRLHRETGFTADVRLGESGRIEQTDNLVMRVALTRYSDGRPYTLLEEPYFHGMVLTQYRSDPLGGSRWMTSKRSPGQQENFSVHVNQPPSPTAVVRQSIAVETLSSDVVFAIFPVHPLPDTPTELRYNRIATRLVRGPAEDLGSMREYRYSIGTMALRDGRQLKCQPHANALIKEADLFQLEYEKQSLSSYEESKFERLKKFTDDLIAEKQLTSSSTLERIKALEAHFLEPDVYTYSLEMTRKRDRTVDPIEDFVLNHRTGHCEYFASALAMMLRTQGIPSRLVIGYKGGEFNFLGHYYQVRGKHAHAWVEAYLPADEVPDGELAGTPSLGGAWYRLDPTPGIWGDELARSRDSLTDRVGDAFDYVDLLWRDYVLGLNSSRQKDSIYDPLTERASGNIPGWDEASRFSATMKTIMKRIGVNTEPRPEDGRQWFDWRTGLLVVGTIFLLITISQVGMFVSKFVATTRSKKIATRKSADVPQFYRRLEAVLATIGFRRAPAETPHEMATSAGSSFAKVPSGVSIASLPDDVVQLYYRVRFGGIPLSPDEQKRADEAIQTLIAALKEPALRAGAKKVPS